MGHIIQEKYHGALVCVCLYGVVGSKEKQNLQWSERHLKDGV